MRRGVLFIIILAALVFFAWQVVLKPKSKASAKAAVKKAKTTTTEAVETVKKGGKRAGKLKKQTADERKAEKARLRAEKRRLKQELRRKKAEERLAKRLAKSRKSRKGKKQTGVYVLQAIVWFDVGPSYAMIDGRKYEIGDVVSGRKIVAIRQDQIIVDYQGTQTVVRMGESVLPKAYFQTGRKGR
jgi:hypothetical protein